MATSEQFTVKKRSIQIALAAAFILAVADNIYKSLENITYIERQKCIINKFLPKVGFIFFEYFVELTLVVFLGVFIAALLEKYFLRFRRFYPSNTITSFIYASILPVCACTTIPIIKTMQEKMSVRAIITFIVAAPLLNPYIITLSFSVLGAEYAILRIVSSFVLSVSAGYVIEFFYNKEALKLENLQGCSDSSCPVNEGDIYLKTWEIFKSVVPYLFAGGIVGAVLEIVMPKSTVLSSMISNSILSNIIIILIGVPLYFCNGTDVLLLRPLLCSGIYVGTGIAFSLTSTAICITSIFMLLKFMGKKLTGILVVHIFIVTLMISQVINYFFKP